MNIADTKYIVQTFEADKETARRQHFDDVDKMLRVTDAYIRRKIPFQLIKQEVLIDTIKDNG